MIAVSEIALMYSLTDGEIAVNNLESARKRAWSRVWQEPLRPGVAECIVEHEQLTTQFLGDLNALDRLGSLIDLLDHLDAESGRTALVHAQIASMAHRFGDARESLARAEDCVELADAASRILLSIDQACGTRLKTVLEARLRMAAEFGRLEDLVPLAALYADLREFDEAERIYQRALREYQDTSPFAVAWVCFQLGTLWGELVPVSQPDRASFWYESAITVLPRYVKARVHLAEIRLQNRRIDEAEALLIPALSSSDPEVNWRLADVLTAMGRTSEAEVQMQAARTGFERLLDKYLFAFADHGAEFYSGSGDDPLRAFELANINLANRPTFRAFEQAYSTALNAGFPDAAAEILAGATKSWRSTTDLKLSTLAMLHGKSTIPGLQWGQKEQSYAYRP
jgi:tetratricopeptide (TPR) repeat protein